MSTGISGLYQNTKGAKIARGEKVTQTNFDCIKAMSVEEIAPLLIHFVDDWGAYYISNGDCYYDEAEAIKAEIKWLESECDTE